ncbi:U-scoloptoxin(01)-Cw1a-like, partial [Diorhabda carinulata]|uniref:U-scoloptoxin(01)-Cw1a-like n=1 Tax=Diorhabda carinulata TaxID=1163345 RepID=UPI0025A2259E
FRKFTFIVLFFQQIDGYIPGQDYPIYHEIPQGLTFRCDQKLPGYYSDPEAQCQVWHWCLPNGQKFSFLCPNGTVFNQYARVCDWWFNVDCAAAPSLYGINEDLYRIPSYVDKRQQK